MRMRMMILCLVALLSSYGCSHAHSVEISNRLSDAEQGVLVSIGSNEVKEGDSVNVFTTVCKERTRGRSDSVPSCRDKKIGAARVVKVLGSDTAIVEPEPGLKMDEDMTVEK